MNLFADEGVDKQIVDRLREWRILLGMLIACKIF